MRNSILTRNIGILSISAVKAFGAALNVIITFFVVRHSSQTAAGSFLFALSSIYIFSYVTRLGSDNFIVSKLSGKWQDDERRTASSLYSSLLFFNGICTCAIAVIAWLALRTVNWLDIGLACVAIFFFSVGQINSRILQAQSKFLYSAFLMSVSAPLFFIAAYAVVGISNGWNIGGTVLIASYALGCAASSALGFRRDLLVPVKPAAVLELCRSISPFFQTGFIAICILWGGQFWAGAILPMADIADIAASQRISMPINLLLVAASIVLSPQIAEYHRTSDTRAIRTLMFEAGWAMVLFGAPVFIATLFFLDSIASSFNVTNKWLIAIFCFAQLANASTGNSIQLLNMTGNQRLARKSVTIGGAIFLLGMSIASALPSQLSVSLAIATALVAQNFAAVVFSHKIFGIVPLWRNECK